MKQNNEEAQIDKLEFSYNLGDQLKIDLEEAKKKQREKKKKSD